MVEMLSQLSGQFGHWTTCVGPGLELIALIMFNDGSENRDLVPELNRLTHP